MLRYRICYRDATGTVSRRGRKRRICWSTQDTEFEPRSGDGLDLECTGLEHQSTPKPGSVPCVNPGFGPSEDRLCTEDRPASNPPKSAACRRISMRRALEAPLRQAGLVGSNLYSISQYLVYRHLRCSVKSPSSAEFRRTSGFDRVAWECRVHSASTNAILDFEPPEHRPRTAQLQFTLRNPLGLSGAECDIAHRMCPRSIGR